ncbi:MFS transporter [Pasteurellaceae bacterium HPA106]|uniref:MFS transporter n=1 Tax=Spirabiliibacterium pneumoniae TaxID=221400 RepID=UPI001AADCB8C|nr:MFS transporter [Spirabiliibacterium pneumoniae]MBE2896056.1 MFS transporter [Spirabiliibacterium pneumoniae]
MIRVKTQAYWRATALLSFSSFLVFCNLYTVQPLLSMFAARYQVSIQLANWIFAAASLGMSLCLIPWAILADRYGRRLMMLLSLSLTALFTFSLMFSNTTEVWIALRFCQGVALAGLPAVAVAYISEEFEQSAVVSAVGIYIAANSIGGISGRLVGGFLAQWFDLHAPMVFTGGITLIGTVLTALYLPKEQHFTPQALGLKATVANLCGHIKNPLLWRTFIISGLCFGMFINLYSVVGLRLQGSPWHLSTSQVSMLFLCYLSGTFAASMAGRFSRRFNAPKGMLIGWLVLMVGIAFLASSWLWLMVLGLLICAIGFFFTHALGSAWVGKSAKKARALASALYLSCYYLGASFGGDYLLAVWANAPWYWVPLAAQALLLIVLWLMLGLYQRCQ